MPPTGSTTSSNMACPSTAISPVELMMSREAAHSERRVIHVKGDMAGAAIMAALVEAVRQTPSIRLIEGYVGETHRHRAGRATGIVARPREGGEPILFPARAIVLATGGIGHLYAVTTNPPESEGAGLGMAARAGAVIADPEFVQFHPTAIAVGRDPAPLATEALRGEGATLINSAGERFMLAIHPLAELAAARYRRPRHPQRDRRRSRRLPRLHARRSARNSRRSSRPSIAIAATPASIRSTSRFPLPRPSISTWAAC